MDCLKCGDHTDATFCKSCNQERAIETRKEQNELGQDKRIAMKRTWI